VLLFVEKFAKTPYAHAVHLYRVLVKLTRDKDPFTRAKVLFCLLSLRANSDYFMQLRVNRNNPPTTKSTLRKSVEEREGFVLVPRDAPKTGSQPGSPTPSPTKSEAAPGDIIADYELTTSPYLCCWEKGTASPLKTGLSASLGAIPALSSGSLGQSSPTAPSSPVLERKEPGRAGVLQIFLLFEALIDGLQYESVHEVSVFFRTPFSSYSLLFFYSAL